MSFVFVTVTPRYLNFSTFSNDKLMYVGPCFHGTARPLVGDRGFSLQTWRVAANMLNKQSWTANRGGPPAWGLVEGLTTPHHKKETVINPIYTSGKMLLSEHRKE